MRMCAKGKKVVFNVSKPFYLLTIKGENAHALDGKEDIAFFCRANSCNKEAKKRANIHPIEIDSKNILSCKPITA